jgi:hypothetical protein
MVNWPMILVGVGAVMNLSLLGVASSSWAAVWTAVCSSLEFP